MNSEINGIWEFFDGIDVAKVFVLFKTKKTTRI